MTHMTQNNWSYKLSEYVGSWRIQSQHSFPIIVIYIHSVSSAIEVLANVRTCEY